MKEWYNIIWSDKTHFEVFNRKNHTFVGRLKSDSNQPLNFLPRVQGGGGHVSIWGCMLGVARDPLVMYSGKINGLADIKIIEGGFPNVH